MAQARLTMPAGLEGMAWRFTIGPAWRPIQTHRHRELEINLVTAGNASYLVADRRVALRVHTLLWLFPRQDHVLIDVSPDFMMWILVFTPELIRRTCTTRATAVLKRGDPGQVFSRVLPDSAGRELERLFAAVAGAGPDDVARCNAGLAYALTTAWAMHQSADRHPRAQAVHPAIERAAIILRDDRRDIDVPTLAQRCGLSGSRLSRLFRQQTGVGLTRYRNQRRVERFVALYGRGRKMNITAAALAAGFGSYPQFHRVFRQVTGQSPARYKRRLREDQTALP